MWCSVCRVRVQRQQTSWEMSRWHRTYEPRLLSKSQTLACAFSVYAVIITWLLRQRRALTGRRRSTPPGQAARAGWSGSIMCNVNIFAKKQPLCFHTDVSYSSKLSEYILFVNYRISAVDFTNVHLFAAQSISLQPYQPYCSQTRYFLSHSFLLFTEDRLAELNV